MHFSEAEQKRLEPSVENDLLVCEGGINWANRSLETNEVEGCLQPEPSIHRLRVKGERADAQFGVYWL